MKAHLLYAASMAAVLALAACGKDDDSSGISEMSDMDDSAVAEDNSGDMANDIMDDSETMTASNDGMMEPDSAPAMASGQASGVNESDPQTRFTGICTSLLEQSAEACSCIYDTLDADQTAYLTASYSGDTAAAADMAVDYDGDMHTDALDAFNAAQQSCGS